MFEEKNSWIDNGLLQSWGLHNKYPSASCGIYPFVFLHSKTQKAPNNTGYGHCFCWLI